ncbi:hypothetical protein [Bradyrhizobium sp. ORS 111]
MRSFPWFCDDAVHPKDLQRTGKDADRPKVISMFEKRATRASRR